MNIRLAESKDSKRLLSIYSPYVRNTPVTFEYEVPSEEEFAKRIAATLQRYPYFVAEENNRLLGYAYASAFKQRAAYNWSVETSIYVDREQLGQGIGTALYHMLEKELARQNVINLCACISFPNPGSIAFHEALGYHTAAHFHKSGYKGGKWYDMVWMEKTLNPHSSDPEPFIPFPELTRD